MESFQPGSQANLLMACAYKFRKYGQCGMEMSELLPHIGSVADDLCLVRSMVSDNNNHPQAQRCIYTGKIFPGRPTLGQDTNAATRWRVAAGASSASPAATRRIAVSSSSGVASLSRNPLAPALIPS